MKLFKWFFEPVTDIIEDLRSTPQIVRIQEEEEFQYDLHPHPHKIKIFRPENFHQYLGQQHAKEILIAYIQAAKERNTTLGHILICGEAGMGKTTLAKIVAHESQKKFKELITSTIQKPRDLLLAIHEVDGGVLFLDEIHSLIRPMAESIYTIMEDFRYSGIEIKPFTLIGATTELGEIISDRRPFVDRFKIILELEDYTLDELSGMSKQYRFVVFPKDHVSPELHNIIAKNCRNNPRTSIRLTEALVYIKNISIVLKNFNIIKDGYTKKDLAALKYIALNEKGVGLQGLVAYLGTAPQTYMFNIEPYLLKNKLLIRSPRGRKLTNLGLAKIKELEEGEISHA